MTALAAANVTVSIPPKQRDISRGPMKMSIADITFGDGALTYPTGGVPLPVIGQFGFRLAIHFGSIEQPYANGFLYKYDRINHKLLIFTQGATTGSTAAAGYDNGALAENSAAAETVVRLSGTAVDTTYDLGPLIQLPAAIAPAAVTVRVLFIGE